MGTRNYEDTERTSQAGSDEDELVRRAITNAQHRQDTPLNGGFGVEIDDFGGTNAAREEALSRFLAHNTIPEGCTVDFMPTVPYSGSELAETVVVKHPPVDELWSRMPA